MIANRGPDVDFVSMRLRPPVVGLALAAVASLAASSASAVGTRTFDLDTLDEFSGGDLKGVAVSSDGGVRAGFNVGNVPLTDATSSFALLQLADGGVLVGTGPEGKVFKVVGDRATLFADTKSLAVTSMVEMGGAIYAATMPDGKIFKIAQGKADAWVTLPDVSHVWALAADKRGGALYAATGPDGRVFRVEASGKSSVHFRSGEQQIVSLAVGDKGEVYAGSSGKALLYKIEGPGRASVLFDFPGEEVKGVAVGKGGVVYAIANEYGAMPEPPKRSASSARNPAGPVATKPIKPGKGVLYRFDATGRPEKMMAHADFHYMALAVGPDDRPYVGTGAEGRVYAVDDAHAVTLVADTDDRQIGAISFGKQIALAGTDAAVFHRVVAQGGSEAVWTSKVLDAGLRAKFGHLSWHATGPLEFSTRTGNTETPDATWSAWSNGTSQAATIQSPGGRFIQVRARWTRDPKAVLSEVMIPFVTENTRPVVTEVDARPKSASKESKDAVPASGSEPPKHETVIKVSWKVDNQDNDTLRYRLNFRREGQGLWRDLLRDGEILTKSEYDWDTVALPEGKYRLRVEASDEPANPPESVQRHALESGPVLVDNSPPVIRELTLTGRRLKARVVDGLGPIARVEMAVDGRPEWRTLGARDGVFDTADEAIDVDVASLVPPGAHIVLLRAYDAAGNFAVREIESR